MNYSLKLQLEKTAEKLKTETDFLDMLNVRIKRLTVIADLSPEQIRTLTSLVCDKRRTEKQIEKLEKEAKRLSDALA